MTGNVEKIKELYIEKGFSAEVTWQTVDLPNNEVKVVFVVKEQDEVKIARVSIIGNRVISDAFIKARIESREYSLLGNLSGAGTYSKAGFERDIMRIGQMYYNEGYVKARVSKGRVELSPDRKKIFITIPVDEGPRFKTGALDITGDFLKSAPKEKLMKLIRLSEGDWFSSGKLPPPSMRLRSTRTKAMPPSTSCQTRRSTMTKRPFPSPLMLIREIRSALDESGRR